MNRRILVLGGGGMLGHRMVLELQPLCELHYTIRGSRAEHPLHAMAAFRDAAAVEHFDAMDTASVDVLVRELRPDVVINCIGVIKQRPDANAAIPSITINALLPHRLAAVLQETGGRLVHFSTDCVFTGDRGTYTEADPTDATDLYGRSKAMGEVAYPNALTLRTSIIGRELRHGHSLLDWFLAQQGSTVRGFKRAFWSGVTTQHLAAVVADLLERNAELSGIWQVSSGRISKYELLLRIRDAFGLQIEVHPDDDFFCDRSLDGSRFEAATGYRFPGWEHLLAELATDTTPYPHRRD